jgi:polyisoprenoid-binding protein YceI
LPNRSRLKKIIALFLFIGQGFSGWAQTKSYEIDVENSQIEFNVSHLGVLNVKGTFNTFEGLLVFSENELQEVQSAIDAKSIKTKDEKRDETLRDTPYLNVEEYPKIYFTSSAIEDNNTTKTITGILRIKDIEKMISFPFEYAILKEGINAIIVETAINRKEFGLDFGSMNALVGNQVKVTLRIGYSAN